MTIDLFAWWDKLASALEHPAFHAVFLALLIGLALTEFLFHLLPGRMPARMAERTMRIAILVAVSFAGYQFHPTTLGAGWALFAGLAAPSIHHHLQSWAYARWPALRPAALREVKP